MSGKLFVIATPIGNLSDVSPRVKACLEECQLILVEDTRVSIKLLNHLNVHKRMVSCHNFNEQSRTTLIMEASNANETIGLLSDAGTPLISDPGYLIVKEAIDCGMQIVPIPGASAFLLALVGSGLPLNRFAFEGFLPDKPSAARAKLEKLAAEERTLVFYVAPHKLAKTLSLFVAVFGERQACIARELTKLHEEFLRGTLSELQKIIGSNQVLGECVLVVSGAPEQALSSATESTENLKAAIKEMLAEGLGVKEISTKCSKQFGLRSSIVYQLALACIEEEQK